MDIDGRVIVNDALVVSNNGNYVLFTNGYVVDLDLETKYILRKLHSNEEISYMLKSDCIQSLQKWFNYVSDPMFDGSMLDYDSTIKIVDPAHTNKNGNSYGRIIDKPSSSYCPDFSQIPLSALERLAKRFELGEKKHGRDNWRKGLTDKMYVVERLNHVIFHAKKLQGKILGEIPIDKDDDIGGILWGGAFASEAIKALGMDDDFDPNADV